MRSLLVRRVSRLGAERLRALTTPTWTRTAEKWLRRGTITVASGRAQGLRLDMRAIPLTHSQLGVLAYGLVEQPVQEALRRHLGPGGVLYDVGANIGFFSLLGARFGATVYAFEPAPDNARAIRANAAANGYDITVIEKAAGARSGSGRLQLVADRSWSKLVETGTHPDTEAVVEVEVAAIDDLELRPPSVVKVDVEGFELDVLEGLRRTLAAHAPVVICELHGTHDEFAAFMRDVGYRIVNLDGPGPVETHALALPPGHGGD